MYWGGLSAISNYNGFQLVVYGGTTEAYYIRKTADNNTWSDWSQLITSRNYEGIVGNKFVLKAGDTMTGRLTAPFFRANNMISVGVPVEQLYSSRAELNIITLTNNPCDIWMGANNQRHWSITARDSTENYQLGIYNRKVSSWNAIFRDNINDFYVKTKVRDTFLVLPTTGGGYNEGIRIGNASNGWSNIQFGSQNAWNGKVDGQWIIGRNPVKYFQICLAGTETSNTSKPGKGISIDINGYLDTGYIRPNIDTEYKANYFYASDDSFIRRTTWDYALNCLNQNQLTLDLSSLDSNKWYPCTINAPAYGGTPLRITIFNGLRGNKPSWASHSSGFSLLLDYYVTGSGWGTLSAVSKLDWYHGSFGGETAFGGRQQNTMGSAEIVYLRGGGVYYYRTTNHGRLTVHPNGYSWANGPYTYSAAVKTSQDNSPMEKTFDQVYWAPANLRTTRNLWGQPFNGTSDVSGALQYVTTINASSTILTQGGFRSNGNSQVGLQIDGSESTRTIIYGKIGSTVNSVVARYAVNWYSEWARFDVHRGGGIDILKFSWKHNDTELMYLGMGGYFQVNGTIVSTGEVTAYSDIRLKTNIKPLDYKGRLAPKWFIKDNKPSIGFIAQEVQALYPELVKVNTSTIENYLSLNYGAITAVLSAQVNKVEDEVEVLKNRIRQLENEVALLKQKP